MLTPRDMNVSGNGSSVFVEAPQGEATVDFRSLSPFRISTDAMKPKYKMEPSHTAIFLLRKDWIHGPKAPVDIQEIVWFTDSSGTKEGTEAGIYGPRIRLLFSLGKKKCKIRLWKWASLSIGRSVEETLTGDFERQAKEGSGNEASICTGLHEGNVEGRFLHWKLQKTRQGRLWKSSISLLGVGEENLEGGFLQ
jgi:hypothetical protein